MQSRVVVVNFHIIWIRGLCSNWAFLQVRHS
uniref:Uncharacterized protein n=1 Tax=Rhizophora mucronata TaxID=61149 RepID=A0A2P2Q6H3_RHIMU